ncbi:hypothetical protein C8R45DRAFT_933064 [Mycena sanguinolenta]|nr:hypothetical protein C8R45DRAFT_933064 [Mycena sanguinolenta]
MTPKHESHAATRKRQVGRRKALNKYYARLRMAPKELDQGAERRMKADFTYREKERRRYVFHLVLLGLLEELKTENSLGGVAIIDKTCKKRPQQFCLPITEEIEEAKKSFSAPRPKFPWPCELLYEKALHGTACVPSFPRKLHDNALCSPEELHTEALASHNFESYQVHDSKSQRFYWIVLDGLKPGIYSLHSFGASQSVKPCITLATGATGTTSSPATLPNTSQPVRRASRSEPSAALMFVSDSDDELVFLTPPTRTITVIPGPGPDPERRRPMCPAIFPLDEKAARQLHLKVDGTRMGPGESSGLNPATSSRRFSPSKRRRVPKQGSASPEPKVALFREDDDNSDNSARPIGTSAPGSYATQSRPVLESASTARSTKQDCGSSGGPLHVDSQGPKGFKPAVAASHKAAAGPSAAGLKSMSISAQAPLDGPFFFNPRTSTIYRKLLPGLRGMEGEDELKWIKTARAMQRNRCRRGVGEGGGGGFRGHREHSPNLHAQTPNSLVPPIETLATEDSTENQELEEEDINLRPQSDRQHGCGEEAYPCLANADDDEDVALPEVAGLTTWAKRNPGKPILRSKRGKRTIGPEQRRTLNDKAKSKKKRMAELQADLLQHNQARTALVDELAVKHRFKPKLVKQRLTASTVFKKARKPSLYRAKLHYLGKVLNQVGLAKNERLDLHELRKRAINYPDFENMSREFKDELLEDLEEHRLTKKTGTRATNKAVAQDASHVMKMLDQEIRNLFDRCGMYGFAIFSKGHVQDKTVPYILESAGCSDFIRECLKIEPMDLVAKFEQWCCSRDLGFTGVDTIQSMRKEVTRMVKDGLIMASKRTKCAMNYERYIKVVVLGYGVIIVGWPKSIDFTSPTNISSVDDMRKLRDSWKDGRCRWKVLTKSEKEKWKQDYENKVESGEIVEVERQRRSDKGRIRGENVRTTSRRDDEEDDEEDEGQSEQEELTRKKSATSKTSHKAAASKKAKSDSGKKSATRRTARKDDHETGEESEEEDLSAKKKKKASTGEGREEAEAEGEGEVKEVGGEAENREDDNGRSGPTKQRRQEGSPKRGREDEDDDEDCPASKKVKDSDGQPKPKPRYKNAPTNSSSSKKTASDETGNSAEVRKEVSGVVDGDSDNVPRVRATVKGKAGRGPPGIRLPG